MKKSNVYLWLGLSLILAMMVAACGGTPVADPPESDTASEDVEVVEEAVEEVAEDAGPKIFTMAEPVDPFDLDPRSAYDGAGLATIGQMYETLTHFNRDGDIVSELALSWEANEDATEWTFVLREGVTFHDGAAFNADAVKKTVEGVRDGDFPTAWIFGAIAEVEVVDDHTVKFVNAYPAALDLIFSSAFGAWMVSPDGMDQDGAWFGENSAGTGAYKMASRELGTRIILDAHADYWGGWTDSKFDTVVVEMVADATIREQMIRSGDADMTRLLDADNFASLQEADGVATKVEPSYENQFIMLNNTRPPLDNPLVRQALLASYPYQDALTSLNGGFGTAAGGAIPQSMWGADSGAIVTQDLEKAKALLAEAGITEGFELEYWAYEGIPLMQQIAEVWSPALGELGIDLKITVIDFNAAMEAAWNDSTTAHHAVGLGWFPTYVTPFDPLFSPFSTEQYFNVCFLQQP